MNPDRWKQVSRIYGVALAKQGHERGRYLDQVCGDDPDLRLEVEALLAESREGETPLDRPVAALAAAVLGDNLVGRQLGPYQLDSLIGTGGMGEVYRATDTRLHRTVAVKVLRSALAEDAQFRARFEREAKAIAALSHPHICTLHDVGQAARCCRCSCAPQTVALTRRSRSMAAVNRSGARMGTNCSSSTTDC